MKTRSLSGDDEAAGEHSIVLQEVGVELRKIHFKRMSGFLVILASDCIYKDFMPFASVLVGAGLPGIFIV